MSDFALGFVLGLGAAGLLLVAAIAWQVASVFLAEPGEPDGGEAS